jgi:hypothetical protein
MKRAFCLASTIPDIEILAAASPMTQGLRDLVEAADYFESVQGKFRTGLRKACKEQVIAATDPWADIEYQSLYLIDSDPENRIILQEPPVKDPMVGVMVLKAARLRGESGLVYCGTPDQLKDFAAKLPTYEERGEDLDEKEFLECLTDAALENGLKIIYQRLSPEHGGDPDDE